MPTTFHLAAADAWTTAAAGFDEGAPYAAASLASEGFIHCTDGVDELGATFDRYYAREPRPFLALTIDLDALAVPWRYDEPGSPYPHIYGPIAREAVVAIAGVERTPDGTFAGLSGS